MKYKRLLSIRLLAKLILVGLIFTETAHAQWIFAARRIEGRINQMSQDDSNGAPASQFATVIINAPANKVYATAVNVASQNPALTIVSQDAQNFKLKVSEGSNNASLSIVSLGDKSSEIMISATAPPQGQDPNSSVVVNSILKICKQMNKTCSAGAN